MVVKVSPLQLTLPCEIRPNQPSRFASSQAFNAQFPEAWPHFLRARLHSNRLAPTKKIVHEPAPHTKFCASARATGGLNERPSPHAVARSSFSAPFRRSECPTFLPLCEPDDWSKFVLLSRPSPVRRARCQAKSSTHAAFITRGRPLFLRFSR